MGGVETTSKCLLFYEVFVCVASFLKGTPAKIHQVDATLFVEQRLNNVVIKVQQHFLN